MVAAGEGVPRPPAVGSRGSASAGESLHQPQGSVGRELGFLTALRAKSCSCLQLRHLPGGIWVWSRASEQPYTRYLREISEE